MAHAYTPTRFDVSEQVPSLSGPLSIAAWVFAPSSLPAETSPLVLVCLRGFPPEAYSFALHMARQGFVVVALDHLGVGESTQPADGGNSSWKWGPGQGRRDRPGARASGRGDAGRWDGSPARTSPRRGRPLDGLLFASRTASRPPQLRGHRPLGYTNKELSIAGMQKRWAETLGVSLDDKATLGDLMAKMYQLAEQGYLRLDRPIAHALFHAADVPASVIEADDALETHIPLGITTDGNDPRYMSAKAARIEVPVFLGNGDLDVSADFHAEAATYPLACDITIFQLAGSAHCHNFATTRTRLWDRLAR